MKSKRIAWVVAGVFATGAVAGGVAYAVGVTGDSPAERREEAAFTEANVDRAAVAQTEAEAAALDARPGTIVDTELEAEGSALIWEVEIADGADLYEVTVDAMTGEVLGTEIEGDEGSEGE